jgi:putative FmdB family regulatory protein
MPFYEYRCEKCQAEFEALVKTMDAPAPKCRQCGSGRVVKKLSVFGVGAAAPAREKGASCQSCQQGGSCPMAH